MVEVQGLVLRLKNDNFVSEIMIAVKMQRQPAASPAEKTSSVSITDKKILKTDSSDIMRAAVSGGVFFGR